MIVGGMLVGGQKRHGSCGPRGCGRGAPELCVALRYGEYGGTGVAYAYAMRCGLPNRGRTMSAARTADRKSTRLNSSHANISYAVFCLKKKKNRREQL